MQRFPLAGGLVLAGLAIMARPAAPQDAKSFDTPISIIDANSIDIGGVSISYPHTGNPYVAVESMQAVSVTMAGKAVGVTGAKSWQLELRDAGKDGKPVTVAILKSTGGNRIEVVPAKGIAYEMGPRMALQNVHLKSAHLVVTLSGTPMEHALACPAAGVCQILIHYCHDGQCS